MVKESLMLFSQLELKLDCLSVNQLVFSIRICDIEREVVVSRLRSYVVI